MEVRPHRVGNRFAALGAAFLLAVFAFAQSAAASTATFNQPKCSPMAVVRTGIRVDENVRTALRGNVHALARAEFDIGKVDDQLPMEHIIMMLRRTPEQEATLQAQIDQMHNRHSAQYHQWLTADEVGGCYGVADQDLYAVSSWLQKHGFKIDSIPAGKMLIIFSGTAGQVREAFQTEIHALNVHGEEHIANLSEPTIPKALAPVIAGFASLHNFFPKPLSHIVGPIQRDQKTRKWHLENAQTKSGGLITYPITGGDVLAVGPQDFYTIYDENPLLQATPTAINGAGQTLAIVQESDVTPADVTTFRSQFGLPAYPSTPNATKGGVNYMFGIPGSTTCTDPGILGPNNGGVEGEADIDVEWMGTTAPAAIIDFVSCASTNTTAGVNLSLNYIVNNLASTVSAFSFSFGWCEAQVDSAFGQPNSFFNGLYEQAVAEGQTPVVAAGDSGDNTCDRGNQQGPNGQAISELGLSVSGLASTPFNVATGGTDFSDNFSTNFNPTAYWNNNDTSPYGSALSYIPEMSWNNTCGNTIIAAALGATPEEVCNASTLSPPYAFTNLDGGSGGVSSIYSLPTWQSAYGVGLSSNFSSTSNRNMPDISLFASDGGYAGGLLWGHLLVFCESDAGAPCDYSSINNAAAMAAGGTSFVAPMFAGILALINQANPSGNPAQPTRQGQANYTLYALGTAEYGTPGSPNTSTSAPSTYTCEGSNVNAINTYGSVFQGCVFNEINRTPSPSTTTCVGGTNDASCLVANNAQPCATGTPNCFTGTAGDAYGVLSASTSSFEPAYAQSAGYNDATGLGSVNITNLVANWTAFTPQFASTTGLQASATTLFTTTTTNLAATVTADGRGGIAPPMGVVTFYAGTSCSGTALGTGGLVAGSGNATASLSNVSGETIGVGNTNVIACFSGDGANDAPSTSSAQSVSVTQTALTVTGPTSGVTITAGQQGTATVQLSANATIPTAITMACTGLPTGDTCGFSTITTLPTSVTVTISTTTSHASNTLPASRASQRLTLALLAPGFLLFCIGGKRKKYLPMSFAIMLLLLFAGCGSNSNSGGGGGGGGGPQNYNVTVTASANNATQGSATFQVTINP